MTMASKVKTTPDGWHSVTPFLSVRDAARAVEFYRDAFGATELERMAEPDGKVTHALLKIGDSMVRLSDDGSKHAADWGANRWAARRCIFMFTSTTRTRCSNGRSLRGRRRWSR